MDSDAPVSDGVDIVSGVPEAPLEPADWSGKTKKWSYRDLNPEYHHAMVA